MRAQDVDSTLPGSGLQDQAFADMIEMRDDSSSSKARRPPPPLPPRQNSSLSTVYADPPPSYDSLPAMDMSNSHPWMGRDQRSDSMSKSDPWMGRDQRSDSMESLLPSDTNQQNERRRLLLIYIHGFMGNETSFRSFPAHVHHLLTTLLAASHVVHTKVYPRYRSKRNISFARDDFSRWLEPHEDPKTDVVLLGHSMGGLLAAEVAIVSPPPPANRALKHRILGIINFDVPFLGMHPGIIKSGLASIFSPAEKPQDNALSPQLTPVENGSGSTSGASFPTPPHRRSDGIWTPAQGDPNYDPSFTNDVVLPMRKGWRNAWHFVNKHSGNLTVATKQLVTSHMEFGGAMANYSELKSRYARIRALEEEDGAVRRSIAGNEQTPPRVRFINYYTASTGRLKTAKTPETPLSPDGSSSKLSLATASTLDMNNEDVRSAGVDGSAFDTPSPGISIEEYRSDGSILKGQPIREDETFDGEDWEDAAETMIVGEPEPMTTHEPMPIDSGDEDVPPRVDLPVRTSTLESTTSMLSQTASLPLLPELPPPPPPLNVSYIEDADTRKLVEKEHARAVRAYDKAVKAQEVAVADRAKLQAKRERAATKKEAEQAKKEADKTKKEAEKAKRDAEKASRDALKAKQKADKQFQEVQHQLTQSQGETLRLRLEKERMEAEGRRMRGEKDPPPADEEVQDDASSISTTASFPADPPERQLSSEHIPDPPEQRLKSRHNPDPPEQGLETVATRQSARSTSSKTKEKEKEKEEDKGPPKDRMFCSLPPKDSNGQRDPCWVRVFMQNVDEVGAHCGLFFVDERYERLVGDVAERIEGWVNEANGLRLASAMMMMEGEDVD
ncbi:hypothetical protein LTR08_003525 [Meristemomyces frigidus]|nr:hypothetical protein LTR08_003525 [Meristemomyces frigidus]